MKDLHAVAHRDGGLGAPSGGAVLLDPLVQDLGELEGLLDTSPPEGLPKLREILASVEGLLVSRHPPCVTREASEALARAAGRLRQVDELLAEAVTAAASAVAARS